jgi:hypothetical protein
MAERVRAGDLLRQSCALLNAPAEGLVLPPWRTGFAAGGRWMGACLAHLRGEPLAGTTLNLTALALVKYGLAGLAALPGLGFAFLLEQPLAAVLCAPLFYAVEAQMVFLFPLALDGSRRPFRASLRWTRRAGGTLAVMRIVMPLAGVMLFGGFTGRGFVRSWCIGCLAVCLWYERVRLGPGKEKSS